MPALCISRGSITIIIFNDVIITRSQVRRRSIVSGTLNIFFILIVEHNAGRYEIITLVKVNALFTTEKVPFLFRILYSAAAIILLQLILTVIITNFCYYRFPCNCVVNMLNWHHIQFVSLICKCLCSNFIAL